MCNEINAFQRIGEAEDSYDLNFWMHGKRPHWPSSAPAKKKRTNPTFGGYKALCGKSNVRFAVQIRKSFNGNQETGEIWNRDSRLFGPLRSAKNENGFRTLSGFLRARAKPALASSSDHFRR
jgi:hypothetical protein